MGHGVLRFVSKFSKEITKHQRQRRVEHIYLLQGTVKCLQFVRLYVPVVLAENGFHLWIAHPKVSSEKVL
jgi:hypothetical protein